MLLFELRFLACEIRMLTVRLNLGTKTAWNPVAPSQKGRYNLYRIKVWTNAWN